MTQKVFVMMSGGVDSSVAAAVLKEQGYDVVGVFMKCWSIEELESLGVDKELYGCFWEEDSNDARMVAAKLNIPFYVWDFQKEYKQGVVDYMIEEYKQGRTPNPDVMCNSIIKFGIFYDRARKLGADFVATGHYARLISESNKDTSFNSYNFPHIARGKDHNKDQTYFIWRIKQEQLDHILFPVGEFDSKTDLRQKAEEYELITATKPDSQGLCFIGETPLRELLVAVIGNKEGAIIAHQDSVKLSSSFAGKKLKDAPIEEYKIIGTHPGAHLYTIGQREKLGLSGGPWFVSKIDVEHNIVEVTHGNRISPLMSSRLVVADLNWLVSSFNSSTITVEAQIRYRHKPHVCTVDFTNSTQGLVVVTFDEPVRAATVGQSIVFYDGEVMLGGGVISKICDEDQDK